MPPVTAERSPPDSRMTGADSPVIADSSTLRDALDHVAVAGDHLAGRDDDHVADLERRARHVLERAVRRRRCAIVSERVARSVAACALPRPSAIASAKFANSTVNHSHTAISPAKTFSRRDRANEEDGHEGAADLDDEHHRVPGHPARIELAHAVERAPAPSDRGGRAASARARRVERSLRLRDARGSARARGRGST